ncbi:MAG: zinc ribbon domain-containing protein [Deltaproteobacteria bacterium]|nr:zinc ribbon domain-containing protein [Deltaproteobacteria bacterium]
MKCPTCRSENPERQKFCGQCGGKLSTHCPSCGAANAAPWTGALGFSWTKARGSRVRQPAHGRRVHGALRRVGRPRGHAQRACRAAFARQKGSAPPIGNSGSITLKKSTLPSKVVELTNPAVNGKGGRHVATPLVAL